MTFKEFITEEVISKLDKDELITAKEIVKIIQSENLQKTKVLYRGFNGMRQYFAEVSNDRSSFYGGLKDSVTTFIKNYLKVKNPTFATTDMTVIFWVIFCSLQLCDLLGLAVDKLHSRLTPSLTT